MKPMPLSQALSQAAIQLHPTDSLAVARHDLPAETRLLFDDGSEPIRVCQSVPAGHKLALLAISPGEKVIKYGWPIGIASQLIQPGDWIHSHNLRVDPGERAFGVNVVADTALQADASAAFLGYPRPNGQAGTRNLIAIVSTVSCSAQVTQAIAQGIGPEMLSAYPNVDGVVAITHHLGCGVPLDSLTQMYLQRVLYNLAFHPNIGGLIYVSLGCEGNQMCDVIGQLGAIPQDESYHAAIGPFLTIQEQGGIAKTVSAGVDAVRALLPRVNEVGRQPVPLSQLALALQCGGSDGWSGVTANPLVGRVVDRLIGVGGSAVLAETPEIYGAEQLLTGRAISQAVGEKLIELPALVADAHALPSASAWITIHLPATKPAA